MPPISRAVRVAKSLIESEGIRRPFVPVERIAERYAVIVREEMPEDVSGMLVPLPGESSQAKWAIVVNSAHPPVRQRFTIAHELGHALLHHYSAPHADGRLGVFFRDADSSKGSVRHEIEANQFAAELLMPEELIRMLFSRLQFDLADAADDEKALKAVARLAKLFKVSIQALTFRIAKLSALNT